jgi:hypothetical protein
MSLCTPERDEDLMAYSGASFSTLGGFKTLIGTTFLVLEACLMLLHLIALVLMSFRTIMKATVKKKDTHLMALWKYKPLAQGDAL